MFKKISIILGIILLSGISAVIMEYYLFPRLAETKFFSRYDFIKKSTENVTVINKTEQVYVKEETSINKITNQAASSVVNIVAYSNPETKTATPLTKPFLKNGTGIIVTSDGLIMTHLSAVSLDNFFAASLSLADEKTFFAPYKFKVMIADGGVFDAEVSGVDAWSGLLFLKISASNLPAASFGDSGGMSAGEKLIIIGNSNQNYQNIYASGLLSGFNPTFNLGGKTVSVSEKLEGVFETDFNQMQNYAGGPAVDYSGQIIGVAGTIERDGQKKAFVIPSDKVKLVMNRAIEKSLDQNYFLGAYYLPLTKSYVLANNLKTEKGALIYSPSGQVGLSIIAGSPAQLAGLQLGDIITKVNGEEITLEKSLPSLLYSHKKGEEVELSILRGEQEMGLKLKL